MQNDILRICNKSRLTDKVEIAFLHKKAKKREASDDVDVYSLEK